MPIGLNELGALSSFGQNFAQNYNQGMNRNYDLLAELEKERRKQATQEMQMRLRQAQTDVNASDIPVSDRPMTVDALGRDLNERMPDQAIVEQLISGQGFENGPWSPDLPTPQSRQGALESSIMQNKSPLTGELVAEKAKRGGRMSSGSDVVRKTPKYQTAEWALQAMGGSDPSTIGKIISASDKRSARIKLIPLIEQMWKEKGFTYGPGEPIEYAKRLIPDTVAFTPQ